MGGIRKGLVFGKPARIGMAMRADDRQGAYAGINPPRDRTCVELRREEPVLVEDHYWLTSKRLSQARQDASHISKAADNAGHGIVGVDFVLQVDEALVLHRD